MNLFFEKLNSYGNLTIFSDDKGDVSFTDFIRQVEERAKEFNSFVKASDVVLWRSQHTIDSLVSFFSLSLLKGIIVPFSNTQHDAYKFFEKEIVKTISNDILLVEADENVFRFKLRTLNQPGLIIATSGTTGEPKLVVHNLGLLLIKYLKLKRKFSSVLAFSLEHISGIETMLSVISPGGKIILSTDFNPQSIPTLIQRNKADLLSCTPTFLKLAMLHSESYNWALTLRKINLGGERCNLNWIQKFVSTFPNIEISNAYGTTESTNQRTESSPDFSGFKPGKIGEDYKVIDGILFLRNKNMMLGYWHNDFLFDKEWLETRDVVDESEKGFLKILDSNEGKVIISGGRKIIPSEVEKVILEVQGIFDACIVGETNSIIGNILKAVIVCNTSNKQELKERILAHCKLNLPVHMIPLKFEFVNEIPHTLRYKTALK